MTTTLYPGGSAPFDLAALGEALQRRMVEVFEEFRLPIDNPDVEVPTDPDEPIPEMFSSVTVYLGSIKSRSRAANGAEVAPQWPLIVIKPRLCSDDVGEAGARRTLVEVDFVIGARRIGNDGFLDVVAIVERIRRSLLVDPVIETRARVELPLDSEIGEDDAFPQWFGVVTARVNIPQPVEEDE